MDPIKKKWVSAAIRVGVCALALWLVVRGVTVRDSVTLRDGQVLVGAISETTSSVQLQIGDDPSQTIPREAVAVDAKGQLRLDYGLATAWRHSRKVYLLLAVMIFLPVGLLQGVRLRWLLGAQQIHMSTWSCVRFSFAGNFLNFAAPLGSTAGDVFKAYYASLHTDSKTEAMTTILLDRIIGLSTLLTVVAFIALLSPGESRLAELRPYLLVLMTVGAAGVLLYLSPIVRGRLLSGAWLSRLPFFAQLQRVDGATRTLAKRPMTIVGAVVVTLALQSLAMGAYFMVAVALGLRTSLSVLPEFTAYFYTGAVVQALPGPPQGLGTVELAYRYFFAPFGSPSQIVCMAFAIRVVVLVCSFPGALVAMTGSYKPRPPASASSSEPMACLASGKASVAPVSESAHSAR